METLLSHIKIREVLNLPFYTGVIQHKFSSISGHEIHDGLEILDHPFTIPDLLLKDVPLNDLGDGKPDEQNRRQHEKGNIDDDLCSEAQI